MNHLMTRPTAKKVSIRCDACNKSYEVVGSTDAHTFHLRIYYAICSHCGQSRNETGEMSKSAFRCEECHVVYLITKTWFAVKHKCMNCIMREYRFNKKRAKGYDKDNEAKCTC